MTSPTTLQPAPAAAWTTRWWGVLTHTHTYSGRSDHGGTVRPPESYSKLAAWARQLGIAALGMGSPYTPRTASRYHQYDEHERDTYYAPGFNHRSALDLDEIQAMLAEVSQHSADQTLFYLDNETPKGRYGHMWWLGYHPDMPAWHDYDQPYDRWMLECTKAGDHQDEPLPYERRAYLEVLAIQRSHGALGFWAHPTSWWRGDAGQFVTNIATEMPAHAIAQGYLDGMVVMGYHPYRPQYQAIWFALLDRGYRIPGVAEMDVGLSDAALWARDYVMLTYAPRVGESPTLLAIQKAFREGSTFVSSGPCIDISVDGCTMGQVASTSREQTHAVRITAYPAPGQGSLGRVELLGHSGRVLWADDNFEGGTIDVAVPGMDRRSYLLARVFSAAEPNAHWRSHKHFAITNPVYLHPAGQSFERPLVTAVHLTIRSGSDFEGGQIRFETTAGDLLGTASARGTICERLPADGRVTLVAPSGRTRTDYLVNANTVLQDVQRYLYRGRFTLDFSSAASGDVPVEAWRLDAYADAMRQVQLVY